MRKKIALAGLVAGIAAAVLPVAPASAQCYYVVGLDRCVSICPPLPLGDCTA